MAKGKSGTESQRAESLARLRNLILFGVRNGITQRATLQQAAIANQILTTSDGKAFSYSRVYVYLDALRFLGFDAAEYDIEGHIIWTQVAVALANCSPPSIQLSLVLSEAEKQIFREQIFHSRVTEQFLNVFCAFHVPHSYQEFLQIGQPVFVANASVKRPPNADAEEWEAETNIELTLDPQVGPTFWKSTKEFLYNNRYWCLDSGIIDELNVSEAKRYGIPEKHAYILFPVNSDTGLSTSEFLELIYTSFSRKLRKPQAVGVPWLMYQICPKSQVSVELFKKLLVKTWQENRNFLHLERGPGGLIDAKAPWERHDYSDRYGNHRYYPVVDGTVRTNLVVFPSK